MLDALLFGLALLGILFLILGALFSFLVWRLCTSVDELGAEIDAFRRTFEQAAENAEETTTTVQKFIIQPTEEEDLH